MVHGPSQHPPISLRRVGRGLGEPWEQMRGAMGGSKDPPSPAMFSTLERLGGCRLGARVGNWCQAWPYLGFSLPFSFRDMVSCWGIGKGVGAGMLSQRKSSWSLSEARLLGVSLLPWTWNLTLGTPKPAGGSPVKGPREHLLVPGFQISGWASPHILHGSATRLVF